MLKNLKMLFNTNSLSVKDLVDHFACNDESPAIDLRNSLAEDAGSASGNNIYQMIILANKETNAFYLESNSGEKVSQRKRAGRLIEDSAYNKKLSAIDVRDSVAGDGDSTTRNNPSQIIIHANEKNYCARFKSAKGIQR